MLFGNSRRVKCKNIYLLAWLTTLPVYIAREILHYITARALVGPNHFTLRV